MEEEPGTAHQPPDRHSGDLPEAKEPEDYSTADYEQFSRAEKPIRNWTRIFSIFILLIALAGAGTGGYWYLKNHKSGSAKKPAVSQPAASAKISTATKHYDSPNFYLGFDYPANWTVEDNGGGVMTVTSPMTQLKNASGEEVSGKIVMTIRNKSQKLPEFDAGNAIAARASVKIAYTKPTQTQRGSTYESFLRYASTTSGGGLDGVYITGDNGYTLGQAIPAADFVPVDPVISITFVNGSGKALTISANSWDNKAFSGPLDSLLESLSIT